MEVKFETKGQLRQKRRLERSQRQRRKECSRRSKGAETSYREEGAIKIQRSTATGHGRELQKPKGKEKRTSCGSQGSKSQERTHQAGEDS